MASESTVQLWPSQYFRWPVSRSRYKPTLGTAGPTGDAPCVSSVVIEVAWSAVSTPCPGEAYRPGTGTARAHQGPMQGRHAASPGVILPRCRGAPGTTVAGAGRPKVP